MNHATLEAQTGSQHEKTHVQLVRYHALPDWDDQGRGLQQRAHERYGEGKSPTDIYARTRHYDKNPVVLAARARATQVRGQAADCSARASLYSHMSAILGNRAAAAIELQQFECAKADALEARQWDIRNHKASYRAALACKELGDLREAQIVCEEYSRWCETHGEEGNNTIMQIQEEAKHALQTAVTERINRVLRFYHRQVAGATDDHAIMLGAFLKIPDFIQHDLQRPANIVRTPEKPPGLNEYEWMVKVLLAELPLGFGRSFKHYEVEEIPNIPLDAPGVRWQSVDGCIPLAPNLEVPNTFVASDFATWTSKVRMPLCCKYAFGIPSQDAIASIGHFSDKRVVEIGAGSGFWARLMQASGIDVVAYDIDATKGPYSNKAKGTKLHHVHHVTVFPGGPEKLESHRDRALFLCWPPRGDAMAMECLHHYEGDTVIYVGEWEPGFGDGPIGHCVPEYSQLENGTPCAANFEFRSKLVGGQ
eukprot:scaffold1687_cov405-Prasinococcus_capsulatus_cf.AAC.4